MKKVLLSLLLMSASAHAGNVSTYLCETGTDLGGQILVFNDRTTEEGKIQLNAFYLGESNSYITNLHLQGAVDAKATKGPYGNEYVFNMDKDPYAGKVGNFVWTFYVPESFAKGTAKGVMEKAELIPMMSWQGTPIGNGNNSGVGRYPWFYCKSLDR